MSVCPINGSSSNLRAYLYIDDCQNGRASTWYIHDFDWITTITWWSSWFWLFYQYDSVYSIAGGYLGEQGVFLTK